MVCNDIKDTLFAKVAGGCPERWCYRILSIVASVAFLFSLVNVFIGAQETITEVEIDALDLMIFPIGYFCMKKDMLERGVMQIKHSGTPPTCQSTQAKITEIDLQANGVPKESCISFLKSASNTFTTDLQVSDLAGELENRFKEFSSGDDWYCYVINANDKVSSTPGIYKDISFPWEISNVNAQDELEMFGGILDPKLKTFAEQTKNGLNVYEIDLINTKTQVTFTVDEMVTQDITGIITSTKAGANLKKLSSMGQVEAVNDVLADDHVQLKYNPTMSSKKIKVLTQPDGSGKMYGKMQFQPLNYVTRVVTQRYKTWDEIWASIGGAWATAVLLVTAFFVQKTVENPKEKDEKAVPMNEVQCFRLRGVSSRRAAIKELYRIAGDAYEGGKANFEEVEAAKEGTEV